MITKRLVHQNTHIISDNTTGNISEVEQFTTHIVGREPDFVKMYIKDLGRMMDLNKSDDKILFSLLQTMGYDNMIHIDMYTKKKIEEELSMPLNTINASIKNLYNAGILIRKAHGRYLVNPTLFARGKWEDIVKIRMEIEYSSEGKVIKQIDITNNKVTITEKSNT